MEPKRKSIGPPAVEEAIPKSQAILLVEDEETLRLSVSLSLKKNGYSVLTAADGRAAVDLFREHAQDINAIILDVTLPGISGVEVFQEVRRIRPDTKIVLTSAYDRERVSGRFGFGEQALCTFIRKPYRIGELVNALRGPVRQPEMSAKNTATGA